MTNLLWSKGIKFLLAFELRGVFIIIIRNCVVYIIITNDCVLYIVIIINDLFWTF